MKFGDSTTLKISSVDKKGRGCGEVGGRQACAHFTIPEEVVEARLLSRRQGKLMFQVERVVEPSPARVTPRCPYAGRCGGCAWQQFDYGRQIELKRGLVNAALAAGGIRHRIEAVMPAPELFYYRNRMDYCVGPRGELGLKEPGRWNAYLDLDDCYLLSPDAVKLMNAFRGLMKKIPLEPWNSAAYNGYARYLVIREGKRTGKRMATIVTSDAPLPARQEIIDALAPFATTIYHGINPTITDLSLAPRLELIHGDEFLEEKIAGKSFLIHPNSFFQTNTVMAEKLYETVAEFLSKDRPKTLLDLYCGVGFFGIALAGRAQKVVGIELDAEAIVMAGKNAERNGVANIAFEAAKAESLVWERERPDAVIVDPPRAGLHPKVIGSLLAHKPERIVYVSCNYESFVRDFADLGKAYDLEEVRAMDMFPHSPHVELATNLRRKENAPAIGGAA
ncbi:23S rRNA (uracil(1939)-C(5))-methyltransferase RlmD [Candidatus Uhrbacteria bacterium]|nr:23S rRNA (uracil(1939)-C(5))-methyltransferase RlmD [Candidatus Uhrbacteria bacterium]